MKHSILHRDDARATALCKTEGCEEETPRSVVRLVFFFCGGKKKETRPPTTPPKKTPSRVLLTKTAAGGEGGDSGGGQTARSGNLKGAGQA